MPQVMIIKPCFDAILRAICIVTETIALVLGCHFVLLLHLVQLFTTNPVETARQTAATAANAATATAAAATAQLPAGAAERVRNFAGENISIQHLPALGPRPLDETSNKANRASLLQRLDRSISRVFDRVALRLREMADDVENAGGKTGRMVKHLRRCESHIDQRLINRLPPELVLHILSLAADPGTPAGIPTKVALLSKAHYRYITPRLYSCVHLADATAFRRFRMTLAVHNPNLGQYLQALSVASTKFDPEGYLPEQVAEHVTLGIGIEQILLASPNLLHLYLDLFSLAALHHGTASKLEKGALPISLTTEFSLPQYLTLPTFSSLRHVELVVFGLDNNAIDWFRQVLPRLESLTLRWVTRRSSFAVSPAEGNDADYGNANHLAWQDQLDHDLDLEERVSWRTGGRRHHDFLLFVEAIELLRRWPYHVGSEHTGQQLRAVTVYAWPKAYRELRKHFTASENVCMAGLDEKAVNEVDWNKSLDNTLSDWNEGGEAKETSPPPLPIPSHVRPQLNRSSSSTASVFSNLPPAPLRLAVDESHVHGPRRGPLLDWSSKQPQRATWRGEWGAEASV